MVSRKVLDLFKGSLQFVATLGHNGYYIGQQFSDMGVPQNYLKGWLRVLVDLKL